MVNVKKSLTLTLTPVQSCAYLVWIICPHTPTLPDVESATPCMCMSLGL